MRAATIFGWLALAAIVMLTAVYGKEVVLSYGKGVEKESVAEVKGAQEKSLFYDEDTRPEKMLRAKAGVVIVAETGKIIFAENAFENLPMASLTKLMSAMVAMDRKIQLQKIVAILPDDFTIGGNLRIVPGKETVTIKDLFYASITGSANNAALTIAEQTGLTADEFTQAMNRKAVELGLESLHFQEASGLSPKNTGTAYDIARMAGNAFMNYPLILDAASKGSYEIVTKNTQREHKIKNPNGLLERGLEGLIASKTGYLDEALYCLVLAKRLKGGTIVAVTLGNPSKNDSETETMELLKKGESVLAGVVN